MSTNDAINDIANCKWRQTVNTKPPLCKGMDKPCDEVRKTGLCVTMLKSLITKEGKDKK